MRGCSKCNANTQQAMDRIMLHSTYNVYIYTMYMHNVMCIIALFANLFHKTNVQCYVHVYIYTCIIYMYNYVKDVWAYVRMFLSINFTALQAPVQKS